MGEAEGRRLEMGYQYYRRGWCLFECRMAMMKAHVESRLSVTGVLKALAPVSPETFRHDLASAYFASGSTDSDIVADLYQRVFVEKTSKAEVLSFGSRSGGMDFVDIQFYTDLVKVLPAYTSLQGLSLGHSHTTADYQPLLELVRTPGSLPSLKQLIISEDVAELRRACEERGLRCFRWGE